MTARQNLNRRFYRAILCTLVVVVILAILKPYVPAYDLTRRLIGLTCFALYLGYMWQTPCQRCHKALRWTGVIFAPSYNIKWLPPMDGCPNCGATLDTDGIPATVESKLGD